MEFRWTPWIPEEQYVEEEEEEEDSAGAVHSAAPALWTELSHPTRSAFERHDQGRGGQKLEALAHTSTDRPSRVPRPRRRAQSTGAAATMEEPS